MQVFHGRIRYIGRLSQASLLAAALAVTTPSARSDFWTVVKGEQPVSVKLSRKLPPVAARNGTTVQFAAEIAEPSTPPAVLPVLREKIRTLLLGSKAGGMQLVDGQGDTVIKCIISGYEPKVVKRGTRQVGNKTLTIETWVGNLRGGVQVLDGRNRPLDAAEIKEHLEKDFVVAQTEQAVTAVNDKKASKSSKIGSVIGVFRGGDAGDAASLAGGGKQIHDSLGPETKAAPQPTDLEWRDQLIQAFAAKVANRIAPVDEEFTAMLPLDKEFAQVRDFAKNQRWGDVQQQVETMGKLQGAKEAYRLYLDGLSYEATAYQNSDHPENATESLNKATKLYGDAAAQAQSEHEFVLAQIRAQDSLDHYLEIAHYLQSRSAVPESPAPVAPPPGKNETVKPEGGKQEDVADNDGLIAMVQAGLPEAVLLNYVKTAARPKFDVSSGGLIALAKAKVPPSVIQEVQKKMSGPATPVQGKPPASTGTKK
jgi:hypothetical protein